VAERAQLAWLVERTEGEAAVRVHTSAAKRQRRAGKAAMLGRVEASSTRGYDEAGRLYSHRVRTETAPA
jgi:hypothetical protein